MRVRSRDKATNVECLTECLQGPIQTAANKLCVSKRKSEARERDEIRLYHLQIWSRVFAVLLMSLGAVVVLIGILALALYEACIDRLFGPTMDYLTRFCFVILGVISLAIGVLSYRSVRDVKHLKPVAVSLILVLVSSLILGIWSVYIAWGYSIWGLSGFQYTDKASRRCWDKIQNNHACCGLHGPTDWKKIPSSCCDVELYTMEQCGKLFTTLRYAYKQGCYHKLSGPIILMVSTLWILATALAIVMILLLSVTLQEIYLQWKYDNLLLPA